MKYLAWPALIALLIIQTIQIVPGQSQSNGAPTQPKGGISFGKKAENARIDNPYHVPMTRPDIVKAIQRILEEQGLAPNEEESKAAEGLIVTQKYIFAVGTHAKIDLSHFTNLSPNDPRNWNKGRVSLTFKVDPIDPTNSQLFVYAKFEGLVEEVGAKTTWVSVGTNSTLEECFIQTTLDKLGIPTPQTSQSGDKCQLCLKGCSTRGQ